MLPIEFQVVQECLLGSPALAVTALIGPVIIISVHELVQILLHFFYGMIQLFPESNLVKLVLNGLVQSFHYE